MGFAGKRKLPREAIYINSICSLNDKDTLQNFVRY